MTVSIDYLCEAINDNFSEGDGMWISTVTSVLVTDVRPGDESLSTIMVRVSPDEYTGEATGSQKYRATTLG